MGLREINATRTRQMIADAAMDLFLERGYDATTMEDVAAHAGVGLSTLYRYFPTKELLVTAHLGDPTAMATALTERPADEPLDVALGESLVEFVTRTEREQHHPQQFRDLLESNGRIAARVVEWLMESQTALSSAVAARRGLDDVDLESAATAWMAVFVLQQSAEAREKNPTGTESSADLARTLMRELSGVTVRMPTIHS